MSQDLQPYGRPAGLPEPMLPEGGRIKQRLDLGSMTYTESVRPARSARSLAADAWPGFRSLLGNAWALAGVVLALCVILPGLVLVFRLVGLAAHADLPGGG